MRREVARAAVTAAWIALAVLAVPLAVSVYLLVAGDERGELERAALRAAVLVDPRDLPGDPPELPSPEAGGQLGLYDLGGTLRAGSGPQHADRVTLAGARGAVAQDQVGGMLVVAVPVAQSEQVTAVVRAASPVSVVWRRTAIGWTGLAAAVAASLAAALAVARRRARRLAAPLEALASASRAIGDGDFTARVPLSGIAEIDRVATTQNTTAERLGDLLDHERTFTANASHQLRTPLAGLQLGLERAIRDPAADPRAALTEALDTAVRLQATVHDVLALHRRTRSPDAPDPAERAPIRSVLDGAQRRWLARFAETGRRLELAVDASSERQPVPVTRVGQILDILLDNAFRHGAGLTQVSTRPTGPALAVEVRDEGPGVGPALGDVFRRGTGRDHGIGLALAREFATSLDGRLVLSARTPPVFTLILPGPPDETPPTAGGVP
jgi:signal transduction histidine kinase